MTGEWILVGFAVIFPVVIRLILILQAYIPREARRGEK